MKINKHKKLIISLLLFSLMAMYGYAPPVPKANAIDSIADASDTITDSDTDVVADHTFDFTIGTTTATSSFIDVIFPNNPDQPFGDLTLVATSSCPTGDWASSSPNTYTLRCKATSTMALGVKQITVNNVTNATTTGTYYIQIILYDAATTTIERVTVAVAMVDDVLMTATVDSALTFTVSGTSTLISVDGVPCANLSSATNTPFGTLTAGATSTVCQELNVTTNADDGYTVTVEQDNEMTSDSGSNINSFKDSPNNTGTTTPETWAAPSNQLDAYHTYGHMGLHSNDRSLDASLWAGAASTTNPYNTAEGDTFFAGFNAADPIQVMYHDGPSDGYTQSIGQTMVIYQVEIGTLQEAGDYENTLTYIVTPTF